MSTINEETERTAFTASVDAQILAKRLAKVAIGATITYDELSQTIKRDVTAGFRYLLETARRIVQRENKVVFGAVHGVGLRRLDDAEISTTWRKDIRHIKSTALRGRRRVACADYDKLTPENQRNFNTGLAVLGFLKHSTQASPIARIEAAVEKEPKRLDYKETLSLFAKNGEK